MENEVVKNLVPFKKWINAEKTINDSLTQLNTENILCRTIRLMAKSTNTNKIYIGSENLTSSNYSIFLDANESVDIEIDNINKIFLIAVVNGEGVNYCYVI